LAYTPIDIHCIPPRLSDTWN